MSTNNNNKEYQIDSRTRPGVQYCVFESKHKGWICECEWYWRTHKACYHIRAAKAMSCQVPEEKTRNVGYCGHCQKDFSSHIELTRHIIELTADNK